MFCQQNGNLLVLNGHPDIVAISKFTKRINFEVWAFFIYLILKWLLFPSNLQFMEDFRVSKLVILLSAR